MLTAQIAPSCAIPIMELSICPNRKNHLMRQKFLFMLSISMLWCATSVFVSAQIPIVDRQSSLRNMLAFVPDNDQTREALTGYIDYRAMQSINGFTLDPANYADFENLSDYEQRLWLQRSRRWQTGPQFSQYLRAAGTDAEQITGFDAFGVDRALIFGNPPAQGMILETATERSAFEEAHRARNYTQTEINGITAWCSENGCDSGLQQDFINREIGNLFDPSALGRRPPVLVTDGYYASAFVLEVIESMADAYNGTANSLADSADYGAITDAILDSEHFSGDLMQVVFLPPSEFYTIDFTSPDPYTVVTPQLNDTQAPMVSWADYGELAGWTLAAIADRQDGDQISAVLMLVYSDQASAEQAATEVGQRVLTFADELRFSDPTPLINAIDGGVIPTEPYVYEAEGGYFVAVVALDYPAPPEGAENLGLSSSDPAPPPGMLFIRWINAVYTRTFDVLWNIIPPEG